MIDALLDVVLAGGTRTAVVVGTAKNVGKTVTFNALRMLAARRGMTAAITSIGRDGEAADALDGARKPRVRVEPGTIVALPAELVPRCPALQILDLGEPSALGRMVFARVRFGAECEIGGPPTARGVRATIERLLQLTAGPVFVDGAIDRIAPLAGGDDAVILATANAGGGDVAAVADLARATVARLTIPACEPGRDRGRVVRIVGALDARDASALLAADGARLTVIVADPTRIAIRGALFDRLRSAVDLRCERPLRVVACTTSSAGPGRPLDPRALARAVAAATRLPTFDVLAGCSA